MSDAIKSFFRKYNAVRATDSGPSWRTASDEALLGWYGKLAPIIECGWNKEAGRDATDVEIRGNLPTYNEVVAEIHTRAKKADSSPEIFAAYIRSLHSKRRGCSSSD